MYSVYLLFCICACDLTYNNLFCNDKEEYYICHINYNYLQLLIHSVVSVMTFCCTQ